MIADAKLTDYLLDPLHAVGGSKARFFIDHGFLRDAPAALATALLHAARHPIHATRETSGGRNHEIRGEIATPDGRHPRIKAIWFQESGGATHRLATAYPLPA